MNAFDVATPVVVGEQLERVIGVAEIARARP